MKQLSERWLLLLLAAVQFTHIMDFMIMMPLGPQLMRVMEIGPGQFAAFVAAYSISSGIVSLLAAPFVDRFDRKKLLLLTYSGFMLGTLTCALAQNAATLVIARAVSGAIRIRAGPWWRGGRGCGGRARRRRGGTAPGP